mmetsp:Transcript_119147/g.297248  ORF Transcript_119147/g.297248 Transcript_119147/m.297248 type:complete len:433 (-) Transcript_119147:103-1401(-)
MGAQPSVGENRPPGDGECSRGIVNSWHDLVQEVAVPKGAVFAIRGDTTVGGAEQKDPKAKAKMSWGRSRMGGQFAAACRRGAVRAPNQDSFFFVELAGRDFALGIMDGYGPRGHNYSELISWHLPLLLLRSPLFPGNVPEALLNAFSKMAGILTDRLRPHSQSDKLSGATCVVVVRRGASVYAANLGDSRAVLYGEGESHMLSKEHRPDVPSETARIAQQGGRIVRSSKTGACDGAAQLTDSMGSLNLSMSRSFGAAGGHVLGLSEVPDVKIYPLVAESLHTLVVGSDGLWDALSVEDVRTLMWDPLQKRNKTASVRDAVGLAVRRWTHGLDEPSAGVPAITCVVAAFGLDYGRQMPNGSPSSADGASPHEEVLQERSTPNKLDFAHGTVDLQQIHLSNRSSPVNGDPTQGHASCVPPQMANIHNRAAKPDM